MSTVYTETPNNIDEFKQFIIEDVNEIKKFFLTKGKIIFMMHVLFKDIQN